MKNMIMIFAIILVSITSVFAGGNKDTSDNEIVVGTEGTYKPYSYHDENGTLTGYDIEVIQAVADEIGYEVRFVESRWDGLLAGVKVNRWDVVANQVWWNESRDKEYLLSEPYLRAGASILVRADSNIRGYNDLKNKKAAVSLTSSFRPYVEELTDDIEFQDDFQLAADLLIQKRVDFLVNDTQSIGSYLSEHEGSGLIAFDLAQAKKVDVVFALNKENTTLLAEINGALQTLKDNGYLSSLNEKYFAGIE